MNVKEAVFWHDAFYEAIQLEFHKYKDNLEFEQEHQLSKEALKMDVLVIKKKPDIPINKNIGKLFRSANIFEFKSEKDSLSSWDYNKVMGYAFLYSSFSRIPVDEITVSFVVTPHPREAIKYLRDKRDFTVRSGGEGIHYIDGDTFPIQILENKKLPAGENRFLRNLRSDLNSAEAKDTAEAYKEIRAVVGKSVYLDRLIQANPDAFEEAMKMSEAAREIIIGAAERNGWLDNRDIEKLKEVAKKLLLTGQSIDYIVEITGLSPDVVNSL